MIANKLTFVSVALAGLLAACIVEAQDQSGMVTPTAQDRFASFFDPVVHTEVSELGGRKVNVHVPGVFDLRLDTRANNQGMRMTQTVLGGLVQIYADRTRDLTTGRSTGPISVKVGGMTMYQNQEARVLSQSMAASMPGV